MSVLRVYVEKRPGFDIEAHHILSDLQEHLGLRALTGLRLANRYDVEGLSADQFESAKVTVFSEPNQDFVYDERWPTDGQRVFACLLYTSLLQLLHHSDTLIIMGKPARRNLTQRPFPRVSKGGMSQIVPQADGFG